MPNKHLNLNFCCYLEWDLFGIETSHYQMSPVFMPSDGQRLERIKVEVFKIWTNEIIFSLISFLQ